MKKVLLPLLLLLAVSFLIAVESAPSSIVGYVKYDCLAGLNLIAVPMDAGYTMVSQIGAAYPGQLTSLISWDAASQSWVSSDAYDDGEGGYIWDPDFEIAPGAPLMTNAASAVSFYSIGGLPTPATYALESGLNLMMVPLNRSDLNLASLFGAEVGVITSVISWDAASQSWVSSDRYDDGEGGYIWDPDFTTAIGMPVMVNAESALSWPVAAKHVKASK